MNPEEKVLPLKEEAPKEEGKPLSKDNEPKTAKAKGGKDKSSVSQKNAHAQPHPSASCFATVGIGAPKRR